MYVSTMPIVRPKLSLFNDRLFCIVFFYTFDTINSFDSMTLTLDEIKNLIEKGTSADIMLARKQSKRVNMHVTGENVVEFLENIDLYENNAQKLLREKLVRSNRATFSFITRPMDKIFTAKGGAVNYNLPQTQVNDIKRQISSLADGLDIKKYLKKMVKLPYIIDPNGIILIDIDPQSNLETHLIGTDQILWYEAKGNTIEAIIFEPTVTKVEMPRGTNVKAEFKEVREYRVIDEKLDRRFIQDGDSIVEIVNQRFDNFFGYVPAMILGDTKSYNDDIFESVLADIIEDADALLRRVSVTNVHELSHLYPRYWSYGQACTRCEGEGTIRIDSGTEEEPDVSESTCVSCGGDGMKKASDPSDEMILPVPQDGSEKIAPEVAGYVSPDLQSAKFYVDYIDKDKENMFQAIWGTKHEQSGKRETATGRWLDSQPVEDRLGDMSDTFAKLHKFMLDAYVIVITRNPRYESSVTYGRRYILESPDDILDKYVETSAKNVSDMVNVDLKNRYFEAEYQNDPLELVKRKKLSKVEPFPTMSSSQVASEVSISDEDKLRKFYFIEWVGTLEDSIIVFSTLEILKESLTSFINQKQLQKKDEGIEI